MCRPVSRRADDVRPAAVRLRRIVASRHADIVALPGPSDAVQPVSVRCGKPRQTVPGIRAVHDLPHAAGRGNVFNAVMWTVQRLPLLDPIRPLLLLLEFG
jgi:hypothetical protein